MGILKDNQSSRKKKQVPQIRFVQESLPNVDISDTVKQTHSPIFGKKRKLIRGAEKVSSKKVTINKLKSIEDPEEKAIVDPPLASQPSTNSENKLPEIQEEFTETNEVPNLQQKPIISEPKVKETQIDTQAETQASSLEIKQLREKAEQDIHDELQEFKARETEQINASLAEYKNQQFSLIDQEKEAALKGSYEEGLKKGQVDGVKELKEAVATVFDAVNALKKTQDHFLKKSEKDILMLSVKIAEKIVQKEIASSKKTCISIIKEALLKITDKDRVIIKTSPKELSLIQGNFKTIQNLIPDIKQLEIEEDDRIQPGGCIIETKLGFVDSSITTKLESIEKALLDTYDEQQELK